MAHGGQLVPGSAGWSCPWVRGHADPVPPPDKVLETGVWARTCWTLNLLTPVFTPVPTRKADAPACPQLPSLCWLLEVTLVRRPAARAPGASASSKHRQTAAHTSMLHTHACCTHTHAAYTRMLHTHACTWTPCRGLGRQNCCLGNEVPPCPVLSRRVLEAFGGHEDCEGHGRSPGAD